MSVKIEHRIANLVDENREKILLFLKDIIEHDSETANKAGVGWVGRRRPAELHSLHQSFRHGWLDAMIRARLKITWAFAGEYSGLIIMVRKRRISEDI